MAKIDHTLFSADQHALDEAYGKCPECDGQLVIKHANKSSFLACQNYPTCKHTQHLQKNDVTIVKVMDGANCPECKQVLAVKKGRYGMFIGCTGFPDCHFIATRDMVSKDGIVKSNTSNDENQNGEPAPLKLSCPKCSKGGLVKRQNKFGKHFYACDDFPTCKYMLNSIPVDCACEACGWKVMLKIDKNHPEKGLICPQVNCQHKQTL
ncbi:MAG: putative DNA topoisomerase [Arenicella sp.]|jgi:putative DNA topoisomerase